ncbi:hypothetical protein [Pseudomonas sp. S3_A03]
MAFQFALLAQDANHPPLLFGQFMLVQRRPEKRHGGFTGLQQGQGQRRSGVGHIGTTWMIESAA